MVIIFEELIEGMFRRMGKLKYLYCSMLRCSSMEKNWCSLNTHGHYHCMNIRNVISLLKNFIILGLQLILFLIE